MIASSAASRARAPGKVVLSGAYAVLDGARAIVAAVDRYVIADAARAADFVTPEVRAGLAAEDSAPWFDASALREDDRKLGLGSSAAILVASLGARLLAVEPTLEEAELRRRVFPVALRAHRAAQGGGSGIDVAASTYGGLQVIQPRGEALELTAASWPADVHVTVLAARTAASTPALIASVRRLRSERPQHYERLMRVQAEASERAANALLEGKAAELIAALAAQGAALSALGVAAGVSIVTPEMQRLSVAATAMGGALLPAGAGGGDIALWVTSAANRLPPSNPDLRPLALTLGAPGLAHAPE